MNISEIPELQKFKPLQLQAAWDCLSEINGLKMPYYHLDNDEIEERIGDYLDETYEVYKGFYTEDHNVLTPEEFDYIYEVLINQNQRLKFDLPRTWLK